MMKLKLEPNLSTTKYSKEGRSSDISGQTNVITTITQSLLAPHLQLRSSAQVPIDAVNSKGFLKAKKTNSLIVFLDLVKSFGRSDNKKALFKYIHNLFSRESNSVLSIFGYLFSRSSSLSSLRFITNTN